ncbi:MAG TPA: hypothetical protein VMI92_04045 [Steroidobacteraceae bacterium]|nr:hypothetical protein [Steroidobacteraceae bacterium]
MSRHSHALVAALAAAGCAGALASAPAQAATNSGTAPSESVLNGVWTLAVPKGNLLHDIKGGTPPLNAAGKKVYAEHRAQLAKGDLSYDLSQKCKPMGFPRVLWDGGPFDIQLQRDATLFGYTWNRNHRIVPNGPKLPLLQVARYYGTGAARWENGSLRIESGMYNENTLLDAAGLPHSENLLISERYTPSADGNKMRVQLTFTDPTFYTRPWTVVADFRKVPDGRIAEDVCQERSAFYKDLMPAK